MTRRTTGAGVLDMSVRLDAQVDNSDPGCLIVTKNRNFSCFVWQDLNALFDYGVNVRPLFFHQSRVV
jgi:hypothetical protein